MQAGLKTAVETLEHKLKDRELEVLLKLAAGQECACVPTKTSLPPEEFCTALAVAPFLDPEFDNIPISSDDSIAV